MLEESFSKRAFIILELELMILMQMFFINHVLLIQYFLLLQKLALIVQFRNLRDMLLYSLLMRVSRVGAGYILYYSFLIYYFHH